MQLLSYDAGTPRIMMVSVEEVIGGSHAEVLFADVVRLVSRKFVGDICLGIFSVRGEIMLAPQKTELFMLEKGDKIIVVTRRMTPVESHLQKLADPERFTSEKDVILNI